MGPAAPFLERLLYQRFQVSNESSAAAIHSVIYWGSSKLNLQVISGAVFPAYCIGDSTFQFDLQSPKLQWAGLLFCHSHSVPLSPQEDPSLPS